MALMLASQTGVLLRHSNSVFPGRSPSKPATIFSPSLQKYSKSTFLPLNALKTPLPFVIAAKKSQARVPVSLSSHDSRSPVLSPPNESQSILTGSTRTVATVATLAFSLSRLFLNSIQKLVGSSFLPTPAQLSAIRALRSNLVNSAGPLFFAAAKSQSIGFLNTPLTVVAAGLARWLHIYSGVLMVRVLLSWFPNAPWDRQPLSAIRDLCDPFLSLFRNIIPPVFGTLDVSPLLAFAILGVVASILQNGKVTF